MEDFIISGKTGKVVAQISVEKDKDNEFGYAGKILKNDFPEQLIKLIDEYNKMVNDMVFSVLDKLEDEIYDYNLMLQSDKTKIYDLSINGEQISFFIKYPTGSGFQDKRP